MTAPADSTGFAARSRGLAAGVEAHGGLIGLVLLGSASDEAAHRRDEWSDHDFFALIADGRGPEVRPDLSWLPEQEGLAVTAREGEIGFVAVYDDGHVFEFALSEAAELDGAVAGEATVVVDDDRATTAGLISRARANAMARDRFDPVNDAALVFVKLLLGTGRARRGESINAGQFVRGAAVIHLVRAIRGRFGGRSTARRDIIDPLRRFERDFPEWGARIEQAVSAPVEDAARGLYALAREVLEPGWDAFPARAADAVARRLGF